MKKLIGKLIRSQWYFIGTPVLLFITTLIAPGLGMFVLMLLFLIWGTAMMNNLFPTEE